MPDPRRHTSGTTVPDAVRARRGYGKKMVSMGDDTRQQLDELVGELGYAPDASKAIGRAVAEAHERESARLVGTVSIRARRPR